MAGRAQLSGRKYVLRRCSYCAPIWAALTLSLLLPGAAHAALADSGQWAPAKDWRSAVNAYAIHMALQPGDGSPYHSRVLWWTTEKSNVFSGGQWGWRQGSGSGFEGCASYPDSAFTFVSVPVSGMDIFCSGQVGLGDGRVFTPGGTDTVVGSYGDNRSRVFASGAGTSQGSWSNPGNMVDWRWYPTGTTLRDGRAMVLGGSRHPQHRIFGGRRNTAAPVLGTGDSLQRFAPVNGGEWEPPVQPIAHLGLRPGVREGHTFVEMRPVGSFTDSAGLPVQVLFGGRDSLNGAAKNDTWFLVREDNILGSDYIYRWWSPNPSNAPDHRSEHSAVVMPAFSQMVVFGGRDANNVPRSDVRRLIKSLGLYTWQAVLPSGTAPSARLGHGAIYDEMTDTSGVLRRRMVVFGGTAGLAQAPSDSAVYELRFTAGGTATWSQMTVVNLGDGFPSPRYWHAMERDPVRRVYSAGDTGRAVFVYGGARSDTATKSFSNELWVLWLFENGRAGWRKKIVGGTAPGARGRHSLTLDEAQGKAPGRLYVYGGRTASGAADRYVYMLDPWDSGSTWTQWAQAPFGLDGHSTVIEDDITLARIPEVYNPVAGTWAALTSAPLFRSHTYPLNFAVRRLSPSDTTRVISVGQDPQSYWLDVPPSGQPGQGWQTSSGLNSGFFAQTGIMYRPGQIMIAGGKSGSTAVGTTKTLNADSLSVGWVNRASMTARYFHNLVLLPTGKVLAVGGVPTTNQGDVSAAVYRPQMWNPDSMTWSPLGSLAQQGKPRNYHSTAVLLPDARVLSASGEGADHKYFGEVYCPTYLFKPGTDNLAPRPVINNAPASLTLGKPFTICVTDTTGITRVALVRPGATTHAFDQNQRYLALNFTPATNPMRLLVDAPATADDAPPGYYMLFLAGSKEGSTAYRDVPSIAHWVRINGTGGRDTCDSVKPDSITTLAPEVVSQNQIEFLWTASGDDASITASGPAQEYDFRYYISQINNDTVWGNAWPTSGEPTPGPVGTVQGHTVGSLACCTWYHFAIRSKDDNANPLSGIHPEVKVKTLCIGCSGLTSGPRGDAETMRLASPSPEAGGPSESQATSGPTAAGLVVETERTLGGGWHVVVRREADVPGLDAAAAGTIVLQDLVGIGVWNTRRAVSPQEGPIGLCALRENGRAVFCGDYALEQLAASLEGSSSNLVLALANHSRTGGIDVSQVLNAPPSLANGEALTLIYEPNAAAPEPTESWYLLLRQTGAAGLGEPDPSAQSIPIRFALLQNQPNPFGGTTSIRFELPVKARVKLEVFDLSGRRVATLSDQEYTAGYAVIEWDRRDSAGNTVRSGILVYRLTASGPGRETLFRDQKRMVLLPK